MTLATPFDHTALRGTLDDIIDHHGLFPVLRALVGRSFRSRQPVPPLALSDHLRRDIGLEPLPPWGEPLL